MNKLFIGMLVAVALVGLWWWQSAELEVDSLVNSEDEEVVYEHELISVTTPVPNAVVASPLTVTGEARGFWFFEADFPVRIFDDNNNELGVGIATAQGEWMTEEFVPFIAEIEFAEPATPAGTIVFERDNPSDIAENDDSFSFPIQFSSQDSTAVVDTQVVTLYFYNEALDTDQDGMVLCSADSVVATERTIPRTQTPAREVVELVLAGDITSDESAAGLSTEYPLSGVSLSNIQLSEGVLTIELNDPEFETSGGSCRVTILRSQLEKTALQFSTVNEVVILPEEAFQP